MPKRQLFQNHYYHIYNRSFSGESIFVNYRDFNRFLEKLEWLIKAKPSLDLKAFCILPNHFHFLLIDEDPASGLDTPSGKLSKFLSDLQNSYAKYFNQKYKNKGPVFDGRFSAKVVGDEAYLEKLFTYIEWNAVKHGIVEKAEDWPYSSYTSSTPGLILEENFKSDFL